VLKGSGRCEEDGVSDDVKESVEDDKDGGAEGFGRAGLTELERLNEASSPEDSNPDMAPNGKLSAMGDGGNDCDTKSSAHSLSKYNVATAPRFAASGARGS